MFRPLWWFLRLGGLFPRGNLLDKYFTTTLITFISISAVLTTKFWLRIPHDSISNLLLLTASASYFSSGFIAVLSNKDTLMTLINQIGILHGSSSSKLFEAVVLGIFVMYSLTRLVLYVAHLNQSVIIAILGIIGINFVNGALIQQSAIVYQLTVKFSSINDELRNISLEGNILPDLSVVLNKHAQLRDQLTRFSSYYSFVNLLCFISRMIHIVMNLYRMLVELSSKTAQVNPIELMACVVLILMVIMHCQVCHKCSETANETLRIAHRIVNKDSSTEIIKQIEMYSITMIGSPVHFSVCGIFNIDRKLVTKITLITVTILIVALQLKDVDMSGLAVSTITVSDAPRPSPATLV